MIKTAMQFLMDGFDDYEKESQNNSITIEKLKEVIANEYIEKEKQQLISFGYTQLQYIEAEIGDTIVTKVPEEIYNETYKTN